jgi:DNA-binding NarL/FixJ family response regulator
MQQEKMPKIRIVIADDHVMFSESIQLVLEYDKDARFVVKKIVKDSEQLLQYLERMCYEVDVLLLDIAIEHKSKGLEVLSHIKANPIFGKIKIVMLTQFDEQELMKRAQRAGANGYLVKKFTSKDLAGAIKYIFDTGKYYFPGMEMEKKRIVEKARISDILTKTEYQVANLIESGLKTSDIANKLDVKESTIKAHRKKINAKLNVKNAAQLIKKMQDDHED